MPPTRAISNLNEMFLRAADDFRQKPVRLTQNQQVRCIEDRGADESFIVLLTRSFFLL